MLGSITLWPILKKIKINVILANGNQQRPKAAHLQRKACILCLISALEKQAADLWAQPHPERLTHLGQQDAPPQPHRQTPRNSSWQARAEKRAGLQTWWCCVACSTWDECVCAYVCVRTHAFVDEWAHARLCVFIHRCVHYVCVCKCARV